MRLLKKQNLEDLLFLDIETVPCTNDFNEDHHMWDAWEYYCIKNGIEDVKNSFYDKAGLEAEFGIIACITIGVVRNGEIWLKTFSGEEADLLKEFNEVASGLINNKTYLCGHVVTGFDAPYIMRRCLVNRILPLEIFDTAHLKPWEMSHLDTAVLWKNSGFKYPTLVSLTSVLGLDSPKDGISGADVGKAFYEGRLDEIIEYCEKDVKAVVDIVTALRQEDSLPLANQEGEPEVEKKGVLTYLYEGGAYDEEVEAKLIKVLATFNDKDKAAAIELLNAIPTKAKGKVTYITKKDIKRIANG
ncbi:3'-5' exonuclease pol-B [Cellulophaga phage Calle_1]|uniref:3'-5' exonuclease pol-B n=1 Tax=Cellulophaga phage Calle_1 TaxID=2745643 RepID=A0A8E4ZI60_9CAUD|nr:3'-5' exonuclease [Cellulophaga phage Calle_1]QQV89733.1 3'-5' exonuclease pol-B [Cellulophaga phage Calle_1]QQV89856.1 3'-5' exonuclease pol-B [Cellulophaga phage Calle_2]QQV89863.1 3'-5' exonuclease pol-B [Cellulophaga phage Calle_3]